MIYGTTSVIAAICSLFLIETQGKALPDEIPTSSPSSPSSPNGFYQENSSLIENVQETGVTEDIEKKVPE